MPMALAHLPGLRACRPGHPAGRLGTLGLPDSELERHIAYDIGAESVARPAVTAARCPAGAAALFPPRPGLQPPARGGRGHARDLRDHADPGNVGLTPESGRHGRQRSTSRSTPPLPRCSIGGRPRVPSCRGIRRPACSQTRKMKSPSPLTTMTGSSSPSSNRRFTLYAPVWAWAVARANRPE